ncbi:MAG: hypothetical protein ACFFFB_24775 [Candidatus Heimdallarchaeota archaeon]
MKRSRLGNYLCITSLLIVIVSLIILIIVNAEYISELIAFLVIILILPLLSGFLGILVAIIYRDFIPRKSMEYPIRMIRRDSKEPEKMRMKISLLGDPVLGNGLLRKYRSGLFLANNKLILGFDLYTKIFYQQDKNSSLRRTIQLEIWDMTRIDRSRFIEMLKYYISGSQCVIIMHDVTNLEALERLPFWLQTIREISRKILVFLIVNKIHLVETDKVIKEEGIETTNMYNLSHSMKTSSNASQDIEKSFKSLVELIIQLRTQNRVKENITNKGSNDFQN